MITQRVGVNTPIGIYLAYIGSILKGAFRLYASASI